MTAQSIRFDDGAAYERQMGVWSQDVGGEFLDWLAPGGGLRWVDVGCGNGAFTELVMRRCAPAGMQGIDPSEGQLAYARTRPGMAGAVFTKGDAMHLPFNAGQFDVAVMALVIAFVPDPAGSVAELARVVRPGGQVATYMWDQTRGGTPNEPVYAEMRAMGLTPTTPASPQASRVEALEGLWQGAGLEMVESRVITVRRSLVSAEEYWNVCTAIGVVKAAIDRLGADEVAELKRRVCARLSPTGDGPVTVSAVANAIRGRVAG